MNYQPPWLVTTLRILRSLPVVRRLPAALDWRDSRIQALAETVRQLEEQLRSVEEQLRNKETELRIKDDAVRAKDEQIRAKEAELNTKEEALRALPEETELELYRLRSRLNRSIARAEQERLLRMESEDTISTR